ncbi:MAG: MFS transporter, partial [Candidatus Nucleicultricaceae bacterium]
MRSFFTSLPFVILSAVSMSVFSFDLYIPCLPSIALWFDTTQEYAKLTISAGIVGSSLFTLILGPLSDAVGRRLILVYSQLVFCIARFIAAFSPTIEFLMVMRFIQGVGSSAAIVLSLAIISDSFPRKRAGIYFAYVS